MGVDAIHRFFTLVAQGEWDSALEMVDESNHYGVRWSEESIRSLIEVELFGRDSVFSTKHPEGVRYSNPSDLARPPLLHVYRRQDGSGFDIDFPVPMNGEWSDLTAQFEFRKRPGGFAMALHDFHVL